MSSSPENSSWFFDIRGLIDDDTPLLPNVDLSGAVSTESTFRCWSSHGFPVSTGLSSELEESFVNPEDVLKEEGSRKRVKSGSCNASSSKACKEKIRRDRLNDSFAELGSILEPGRPPKMDKAVLLSDAVRMVTQLREEAQKLKESNESFQEKINELKAEKNELREEKQTLKAEKEILEMRVKAMSTQPTTFLHQAPRPMAMPFPPHGQVAAGGGKMMPFMGYPGVTMWQFMPPAAVDVSQDHILRPPVA